MGTAKEGKTTPGKMTNVDIDKLDTDNYAVWSFKMKAFLIIKDLWGAVSGQGEPKPEADGKALAQLALQSRTTTYHCCPRQKQQQRLGRSWRQSTKPRAQQGSYTSRERSTAYARSPVSLWSST